MAMAFDRESVARSFRWLGHGDALTEFNAFHPMYRPGRQNAARNRKWNAFPVVRYVRSEGQLIRLLERYHGTHTVCYGMNPRMSVKRYASGHPRAHRDDEIEMVKNFYFDFDLRGPSGSEGLASLELFLEKVIGRIEDRGCRPPVKAFTGNGFHLLFSIPGIRVGECSDIKERIRAFREDVLSGFEGELAGLPARVDATDDLSRMAKVYGTAKPGGKALSRFYGDGTRHDDTGLREHILAIETREFVSARSSGLEKQTAVPERFSRLLRENRYVRDLWLGHGKKTGDLTRSGYDYSLLKECLARGITDVRDLAAILAMRPGGSVRNGQKGERYIRHTVSKAVREFQWGTQ